MGQRRALRIVGYTAGIAALLLLLVNAIALWQGWQRSDLQAPAPSRWVTDRSGEFLAEFEARNTTNRAPRFPSLGVSGRCTALAII